MPCPPRTRPTWTHDHVFDGGNALAKQYLGGDVDHCRCDGCRDLAGWWFNSMALLADGWHMSPHTFAIGVSAALAYAAARTIRASLSAPGKSRSSEASPAPSSCSAWQ
ncbi:hypothetical protein [Thauera humireducens]|uniref:hypothetical protein n=1 Tax=Thauera humireducens TaxID=1134435 RepID=UPI0031200119